MEEFEQLVFKIPSFDKQQRIGHTISVLKLRLELANKQIKTKNMTENKTSNMNLDHERKIVELQERVNKLEDLCFTTKEILNLEEASAFLDIA